MSYGPDNNAPGFRQQLPCARSRATCFPASSHSSSHPFWEWFLILSPSYDEEIETQGSQVTPMLREYGWRRVSWRPSFCEWHTLMEPLPCSVLGTCSPSLSPTAALRGSEVPSNRDLTQVQTGHDAPGPSATDWWRQCPARVCAPETIRTRVRLPAVHTQEMVLRASS